MDRKRAFLIAAPVLGLWLIAGGLAWSAYKAGQVAAEYSADKALADYLHSIPLVFGWASSMVVVMSLWLIAAVTYAAKKI